jgi:hypothetical protein
MQELSQPIAELGGRTWEELEIVEHQDGHLLFRDAIRRRSKGGAVEMVPVRVKILRTEQIAQARSRCRRWFAELGLDEDRDKDLFAELEQVCVLAVAIRDPEHPYAQRYEPEDLARQFDEASLQDVLGRIQALRQVVDVRASQLTEDEVWRKVHAVARAGHLLPLTDIAGPEQPSCIVFMAEQAMNSPRGQSWLQSAATLTAAHSDSASSQPSSGEATGSASSSS